MKKLYKLGGIAILAMSFTVQAGIILPDFTDVGSLDTFIVEDAKVGSPDNERDWVQGQLGDPTIAWTISQFNVPYFATTTANIFAFSILDDPQYFIVRTSNRIALFKNNPELGWGVFDTTFLSGGLNIPSSDFSISHVTSLNGDPDGPGGHVPEPKLLSLLGLGLIGLGIKRKYI